MYIYIPHPPEHKWWGLTPLLENTLMNCLFLLSRGRTYLFPQVSWMTRGDSLHCPLLQTQPLTRSALRRQRGVSASLLTAFPVHTDAVSEHWVWTLLPLHWISQLFILILVCEVFFVFFFFNWFPLCWCLWWNGSFSSLFAVFLVPISHCACLSDFVIKGEL